MSARRCEPGIAGGLGFVQAGERGRVDGRHRIRGCFRHAGLRLGGPIQFPASRHRANFLGGGADSLVQDGGAGGIVDVEVGVLDVDLCDIIRLNSGGKGCQEGAGSRQIFGDGVGGGRGLC